MGFLLSFQDHGTKFCDFRPIASKRAKTVVLAPVYIFTLIGPPKVLQADNGRGFSEAAGTSSSADGDLYPEVSLNLSSQISLRVWKMMPVF